MLVIGACLLYGNEERFFFKVSGFWALSHSSSIVGKQQRGKSFDEGTRAFSHKTNHKNLIHVMTFSTLDPYPHNTDCPLR
jgi:hypothetical protein